MASEPARETSRLLAEWIGKNDLTQQRAADIIGVYIRQITYWLDGGSPQKKNLEKLSKALGIPVDDFYPKPDPIKADVVDRMEVLEGQFNEGFADLDERLTVLEKMLNKQA